MGQGVKKCILYLQCVFSWIVGVVLGAAGAANLKPNIEARQKAAAEFADRLRGIVDGMMARGLSQRAMCEELNDLGVKTARGGQ